MAVAASTILDRVRTQLIDTAATQRWTDTELLRWLSDGQRTIVAMAPSASSSTVTQALTVGTKQYINDGGHMLLTIIRNNNVAGTAPGRVVRVVSREMLDAQNPDWHSSSASAIAQNYIFDPAEPKIFYVFPPNNGLGAVDLTYSILPVDLTSTSDTLVVQEIYQTALVDYVLYRAHQKDSDYAAGMAVSQNYLQLFMAYMQAGEGGQLSANPNLQLAAPDPGTKATAR